jgi:hypothetical protein
MPDNASGLQGKPGQRHRYTARRLHKEKAGISRLFLDPQ